jgi:hypothetical protein
MKDGNDGACEVLFDFWRAGSRAPQFSPSAAAVIDR